MDRVNQEPLPNVGVMSQLTDGARVAMFYARAAVSEHGGTSIGLGHMLLGILRMLPETGTATIESGAAQGLSECVTKTIVDHQLVSTEAEIPLGRDTKRVIDQALRVAQQLGAARIAPEHVLLVLLDETDDVATCLRRAGVTKEKVMLRLTP